METINEKAAALYELWDDCAPVDGVHDLLLLLLYKIFLTEGSEPREAQLRAALTYKKAIRWRGAERYGLSEPVSLKHHYGEPFEVKE